MSVNSTKRNAMTINGTKGITVENCDVLFLTRYETIPNNAPIHTEIRNTANPWETPKKAPTPRNKSTSPKPRPLPRVMI